MSHICVLTRTSVGDPDLWPSCRGGINEDNYLVGINVVNSFSLINIRVVPALLDVNWDYILKKKVSIYLSQRLHGKISAIVVYLTTCNSNSNQMGHLSLVLPTRAHSSFLGAAEQINRSENIFRRRCR